MTVFGPSLSSHFTVDSRKENPPDTGLPVDSVLQTSIGCRHSTVNLVLAFRKWGWENVHLVPTKHLLRGSTPRLGAPMVQRSWGWMDEGVGNGAAGTFHDSW